MDMGTPPLRFKILLESNPLKSRILIWRSAVLRCLPLIDTSTAPLRRLQTRVAARELAREPRGKLHAARLLLCRLAYIYIYIYIYMYISYSSLLLLPRDPVHFQREGMSGSAHGRLDGAEETARDACNFPRGSRAKTRVCSPLKGAVEVSINGKQRSTADLRTKILHFRGFDSSRILNLREGIPRSIGSFPEVLSQRILAGIILVGRLGVRFRKSRTGLKPISEKIEQGGDEWPQKLSKCFPIATTKHSQKSLYMSCDIHIHTPARKSCTNFLLYH